MQVQICSSLQEPKLVYRGTCLEMSCRLIVQFLLQLPLKFLDKADHIRIHRIHYGAHERSAEKRHVLTSRGRFLFRASGKKYIMQNARK